MKIVLAPNAFKDALSAGEVACALQRGLRRVLPKAEIVLAPMADGGDGTLDVLVQATGGRKRRCMAQDPLGRSRRVSWGALGDGKTAVVDMAAVSGLALLRQEERDPLQTSSYGTGMLIRHAAEAGYSNVLLCVGGSATVDGGVGAAQALEFCFAERSLESIPVPATGAMLSDIRYLFPEDHQAWLKTLAAPLQIQIACDVDNPLLGRKGAAAVYAPQKGASAEGVRILKKGLSNLARVLRHDTGISVSDMPGGGAAGGIAAGLHALCGAQLIPGAELVARHIGLERMLQGAQWVITGEGQLDSQTANGKAPQRVAEMARSVGGLGVIAIGGKLGPGAEQLLKHNGGTFDALFALADGPMSVDESMGQSKKLLEKFGVSLGGVLGSL